MKTDAKETDVLLTFEDEHFPSEYKEYYLNPAHSESRKVIAMLE